MTLSFVFSTLLDKTCSVHSDRECTRSTKGKGLEIAHMHQLCSLGARIYFQTRECKWIFILFCCLILRYLLSFPWQQGVREDDIVNSEEWPFPCICPYLEVMASISFNFIFNRKTPFFILSFRQVHWVHCISTEAKDMVLFTLPQKVSINCFQMLAAMWNPA